MRGIADTPACFASKAIVIGIVDKLPNVLFLLSFGRESGEWGSWREGGRRPHREEDYDANRAGVSPDFFPFFQ